MARCDCAGLGAGGCMCALTAGDNITVTGTGQALDPWVVNADPYTEGTAIDIVANVISVDISADAGNQVTLGGDGGLFVPVPAPPVVPSSFIGMIVTTVAGTSSWTKAANPDANWLHVRVIGGGGGGAGATSGAGAGQGIARGGGAGGNYSESWIDVSTLGASTTVTVGAGGALGSSANGAGGTGGTSSFGAVVTALGGNGAPNTGASATSGFWEAGAPQGLGVADLQALGSRGVRGIHLTSGIGSAGDGGQGGAGFGTGGRGGITGTINGQTGSGPGGGGGGGLSMLATPAAGGAGAPGAVYIEMFR